MKMINWACPRCAQAYLRVPSGYPVQWVPIGLTWVFLLQFKNFQVLIMSKNEVGFFLPIRLIRHASGRGGAGGAFPGYLGAVLVCPKHLGPSAPWFKTEDQNIAD